MGRTGDCNITPFVCLNSLSSITNSMVSFDVIVSLIEPVEGVGARILLLSLVVALDASM